MKTKTVSPVAIALVLSVASLGVGCKSNSGSTDNSGAAAAPSAAANTAAAPSAAAPSAAAPSAAPAGAPTCQAVVEKLIALGGGNNPIFNPSRHDSMIAGCTRANNLPQHTTEANCILAAHTINDLDGCGHAMDLIGPW